MPELILFEDERAGRFEPVALTRSVARLRLGLWTHRERWQRRSSADRVSVICREAVAPVERASGEWAAVNEPPTGDVLFVAAALGAAPADGTAAVLALEPGTAVLVEGRPAAARAQGAAAAALAGALAEIAGPGTLSAGSPDWPRVLEEAGLAVREFPAFAIPDTLVDLVAENGSAIEQDFAALESVAGPPDPSAWPGVHLVAPERIRLGEDVRLDAGAVLDAREGPIALGRGTHVMANGTLLGPVAAAGGCVLKPGARVMDGVSLGPVCKVGGEVDATIVQGWSNKQHDGFLGHSYLGCWVNLGAATDTSDLKNDYGPVRVILAGATVDTGRINVGSLIGDHSKTAIHTRLNTGTVIGVSANVFCPDFPDREVPSFTWGGGDLRREYRLEKAVRVAAVVTARRGVAFGPADEALFARIHETSVERRRAWLEGSAA